MQAGSSSLFIVTRTLSVDSLLSARGGGSRWALGERVWDRFTTGGHHPSRVGGNAQPALTRSRWSDKRATTNNHVAGSGPGVSGKVGGRPASHHCT